MKGKHSQLVLERNGNVQNMFGIKWKHSQLVWNEMETFTTRNLFGMKCKHSHLVWSEWKQSQHVWNEMETFTISLERK